MQKINTLNFYIVDNSGTTQSFYKKGPLDKQEASFCTQTYIRFIKKMKISVKNKSHNLSVILCVNPPAGGGGELERRFSAEQDFCHSHSTPEKIISALDVL